MPIGYYLKKADNLLTAGINQIHKEFGISRLHWQAMHFMHESGSLNPEKLKKVLKEFAEPDELDTVLADLMSRGWIFQNKRLIMNSPNKGN